jgi:hypothetical protein
MSWFYEHTISSKQNKRKSKDFFFISHQEIDSLSSASNALVISGKNTVLSGIGGYGREIFAIDKNDTLFN